MTTNTMGYAVALFAVAFWLGVGDAAAKTVPNNSTPESMKSGCQAGGGTYLPPTDTGAYGCINKNGDTVVCGGQTEQQKKTCDVARRHLSLQQRLRREAAKPAQTFAPR
jgi:hypothetical protein